MSLYANRSFAVSTLEQEIRKTCSGQQPSGIERVAVDLWQSRHPWPESMYQCPACETGCTHCDDTGLVTLEQKEAIEDVLALTIETQFDYPPVPFRDMDWSAWVAGTEDEGMVIGHGPTEPAAIANLREQLLERAA